MTGKGVSIWLTDEQHLALRHLALRLNIRGQRDQAGELPNGISPLVQWLGDVADGSLQATSLLLEIAGQVAAGGDLYELLEAELDAG